MDVPYLEMDDVSNTSYAINVTELHVVPTELRQDVRYIQVVRCDLVSKQSALCTVQISEKRMVPWEMCDSIHEPWNYPLR